MNRVEFLEQCVKINPKKTVNDFAKEIDLQKFEVIQYVYAFHPSISEVNGKSEIAQLYINFGWRLIMDMFPTAKKICEWETKQRLLRNQLEELQEEKKSILSGEL